MVCFNNEFWRMSKRIRGITYDICRSEEMAHHSAQTLAEFHKGLINVTGIDSPISRFTDFQYRIDQFNKVLSNGCYTRLKKSNDLIGYIKSNLELIKTYLKVEKSLPLRVIHGDPKVSNFLFNEKSSKVISLIDIDTIMTGSILYDFGDMVRSFASILSEDDTSNSSKFSPVLYKSLLEGYMTHGSEFLIQEEVEGLPLSVLSVSLIQGMRFLTDYINNDVYYRVYYPHQNLHRAKNQLRFYAEAKDHLGISY